MRDGSRLLERAADVAVRMPEAQQHVVWRVIVEERLACARLQQRRQLLVVDQHVLDCVSGLRRRLRDDDRDRLTNVTHTVRREDGMRDAPDLGILRRGDRKSADAVRDVGTREREMDARQRTRRVGVDSKHARVRIVAADKRGVQHPRQAQVVDELRLALGEPSVLEARECPADPRRRRYFDGCHPAGTGEKCNI